MDALHSLQDALAALWAESSTDPTALAAWESRYNALQTLLQSDLSDAPLELSEHRGHTVGNTVEHPVKHTAG